MELGGSEMGGCSEGGLQLARAQGEALLISTYAKQITQRFSCVPYFFYFNLSHYLLFQEDSYID